MYTFFWFACLLAAWQASSPHPSLIQASEGTRNYLVGQKKVALPQEVVLKYPGGKSRRKERIKKLVVSEEAAWEQQFLPHKTNWLVMEYGVYLHMCMVVFLWLSHNIFPSSLVPTATCTTWQPVQKLGGTQSSMLPMLDMLTVDCWKLFYYWQFCCCFISTMQPLLPPSSSFFVVPPLSLYHLVISLKYMYGTNWLSQIMRQRITVQTIPMQGLKTK